MLGSAIAIACVLADPVELRWNAPRECPSEQDVRARVERYVGEASAPDNVRVEANVTERDGGRWLLVLTTTDANGEVQTREIEDADCEGLAESAAVLAALAVAPQPDAAPALEPAPAAVVEPPPSVPNEPEVETDTEPPPAPIEPPVDVLPPRASRPPLRYGLRLGGGLGFGWLPLGGDLGLAVTIGGRRWAAELEGLIGLPRSVRLTRSADSGADLLGWSVAGRGCGVLPLTPWLALPLCAGLEAGQVRASAVGLEDASDAALPWVAGLASVSLRAAVHPRVSLWVMPELQVGARRPVFSASDEQDEVFASSVASGRVRVGLEFVF